MTELEEVRRIYDGEIVPQLLFIRAAELTAEQFRSSPEAHSQALYENVVQRMECLQQSVLLDRRVAALEAEMRHSA